MDFVEKQRVPYEATELRGEKLLVLAPHPDDEVIGSGGLVALHTAERRRVRVVVASDGVIAGSENADEQRTRREKETVDGLRHLGVESPVFLRFPDRQLADHQARLAEQLKRQILEFGPDLLVVPSPVEVHPDHEALCRAVFDLIQSDEELVGPMAICRIAFAEISQPIRPNTIVDITAVAEKKFEAIRTHASQIALKDYERYARGLNEYRSMTLGDGARFAEGYYLTDLRSIRTRPWSSLVSAVGGTSASVVRESVPISVVIRTRNRPNLLQQAVQSVWSNDYPAKVVVVNDGGSSPRDVLETDERLSIVEHERSRGRSEAMNAGVREASSNFIAFLDDDDLFYPEHLPTLARAAASGDHRAWYSDAVSVFLEPAEDGSYRERDRMRIYARDFDPDLLRLDNFIPLTTLLVRRAEFLDAGGFDPKLDLFEDWDFLLRLAARGTFLRIPRVTCEVRHYSGGDSIVLSQPEGSEQFRKARVEIWRRHGVLEDEHSVSRAVEAQKGRFLKISSQLTEQLGRGQHLEKDLARLEREKQTLLKELERVTGERDATSHELKSREAEVVGLTSQLSQLSTEYEAMRLHRDRTEADLRSNIEVIGTLHAEIARLTKILDTIYASRTWKLHTFLEKIRPR